MPLCRATVLSCRHFEPVSKWLQCENVSRLTGVKKPSLHTLNEYFLFTVSTEYIVPTEHDEIMQDRNKDVRVGGKSCYDSSMMICLFQYGLVQCQQIMQ